MSLTGFVRLYKKPNSASQIFIFHPRQSITAKGRIIFCDHSGMIRVLLMTFALVFSGETIAQIPAGGMWTYRTSTDKFTSAEHQIFELMSAEPVTDGTASGKASFMVICDNTKKGPKWTTSKLTIPIPLGKPDSVSAYNLATQIVQMRTDNKIRTHAWNECANLRVLLADKGSTVEFLNSSDVRIQFRDASERLQVIPFFPLDWIGKC